MLRITRAQLISKVCVRQTQSITPLASRGLKSSAIARFADANELETTSLTGRKFVPKFAQEEHLQIRWRNKPRTEPPVTLPRKAASLPIDTSYATLFTSTPVPATQSREKYKEFVKSANANLHYLKIPKNMRPLIFREKNSDVLEELNILYPGGEPVTPLPPRTMAITSGIVSSVINNAETLEDLYAAREFLHDAVIYAPDQTNPGQLLALYNKYIEVGGFGKAESMLRDPVLSEYLLQEAARVGTLRSKVLYRAKNKTKGLRDTVNGLRRVYKIDVTKSGHVELPVELLFIYYLASTGLASDFPKDIVQQVRKYKIDPDMTAKREGATEAALRSRILFKNFVASATQTLEETNAKGLKNVPQAAANDMYLDAKITLDALSSPTNDWNIDTQGLAKQLKAYIALLHNENVDKKAVEDKINFYANSRKDNGMSAEAEEAAEKVAAARNNADPTYSEEVREGIYDKEPTVDGKTVEQLDAEEAEIGREAKAHKKAAPIKDDGMSPEAKAAAEKVAAARNDPAPTYSEEVREGIHDKEPTVDGKTVEQLDAEEAKANKKAAAPNTDGMSPEAKAAAEKVAAARNDPAPTYSEEVREGIYDQEPTVDGKTVDQLDAEEAKIATHAKLHPYKAGQSSSIKDDGMSPEAKAAADKVAAARNDPAPTYSEEVREGIYDAEPTVDGKTVEQLDAEEAKIATQAKLNPYKKAAAPSTDGMSAEAKAAAEKVAAARSNTDPTYSEEVREGIYDKEPTVDGKTVEQLDAEEAEIGREAKAHKKATPIKDDGMSPEAKAAAEKVAAARNDPAPTYSEEVREGIHDKEPTVDGKTVEQLDAEEAKIATDAKLRREGKLPKE
jgi:Fe-S-cluster formation regulator IscX/YfhJ